MYTCKCFQMHTPTLARWALWARVVLPIRVSITSAQTTQRCNSGPIQFVHAFPVSVPFCWALKAYSKSGRWNVVISVCLDVILRNIFLWNRNFSPFLPHLFFNEKNYTIQMETYLLQIKTNYKGHIFIKQYMQIYIKVYKMNHHKWADPRLTNHCWRSHNLCKISLCLYFLWVFWCLYKFPW